ncbi:MAG: type II secretion system secretin GspD [Methylococcales bacterium]
MNDRNLPEQIINKFVMASNITIKCLLIQSLVLLAACETIGPDRPQKLPLEPLEVMVDQEDINSSKNADANKEKDLKPVEPEIWEGTGETVHFHGEKQKKPPQNGKYTLNFDDADLSEVAKVILGDTLNENYVLSPRVGGRVTLQTSRPLTRDELLPSLEMLLRMNNAALVKTDGLYKIEPVANALRGIGAPSLGKAGRNLPAGYQLRIVPLQFIGVKEMQEILKPIMDPKALIRADMVRNMLMLAGTSEELENLLDTIHTFDVDWMNGMSAGLFTLQHVEVEEIQTELEEILGSSTDGPTAGLVRLIPLERLNAILVITPQPVFLKKAKTWIGRLDKAASDGFGGEGVYVYKVANVVAVELAETLNDIFSGKKKDKKISRNALSPGSKRGKVTSKDKRSTNNNRRVSAGDITDVNIVPDEVNNALVITASQSEYEAIKGVIKQLDVVPLQVMIDAKIVEVTLDDTYKYGIDWSGRWGTNFNPGGQDAVPARAFVPAVPASPSNPTGTPAIPATEGTPAIPAVIPGEQSGAFDTAAGIASSLSTYGIFHGFQIQAKLNALAKDDVLNIISTPTLLVLNNQEAFINVGDRVPIPTTQVTNVNSTTGIGNNIGTNVANNIQYQDTGVTLKVTPRVNPGGLVIMEIEQESNAAIATLTSSLNAPTIRQRKITSTLAVQNGDTIVLGGLIQETSSGGTNGIPILSKLPLIGPLFGTKTKSLNRTELIVLLTPRVIENREDGRQATRELQRKMTGVFEEERLPSSEDIEEMIEKSDVLDQKENEVEVNDEAYKSYMQ